MQCRSILFRQAADIIQYFEGIPSHCYNLDTSGKPVVIFNHFARGISKYWDQDYLGHNDYVCPRIRNTSMVEGALVGSYSGITELRIKCRSHPFAGLDCFEFMNGWSERRICEERSSEDACATTDPDKE